MGIKVEFNPDLALRNFAEYQSGRRLIEECIPAELIAGHVYPFLKKDQRNYWLLGVIPLLETKGNEVLSRPMASIRILEATHCVKDGTVFTRGKFLVVEVFEDSAIHFESYAQIDQPKRK